MKILGKIDGFYVSLVLILLISAVVVVLSFKTIFSSLLSISETPTSIGEEAKVDVKALDKAIGEYNNKSIVRLDISR